MALLPARTALEREHLERAKRRLDTLALYPEPVRMGRVRIVSVPWLFAVPGFRRFFGYEFGPLILVKRPIEQISNDLVTHELTHVWQDQHVRVRMWLSYLRGYKDNPYEIEAREAVAATREVTGPGGDEALECERTSLTPRAANEVEPAGFEPATSACKRGALPTELWPLAPDCRSRCERITAQAVPRGEVMAETETATETAETEETDRSAEATEGRPRQRRPRAGRRPASAPRSRTSTSSATTSTRPPTT